jgi:hypothetical protein
MYAVLTCERYPLQHDHHSHVCCQRPGILAGMEAGRPKRHSTLSPDKQSKDNAKKDKTAG